MVEHSSDLDSIFASLSDPTRRDIIRRMLVARKHLTVGDIARPYAMSFAAVSKHLKVLEKAGIVSKERSGRQQRIRLNPQRLKNAAAFLRRFDNPSPSRFGTFGKYIPSFLR